MGNSRTGDDTLGVLDENEDGRRDCHYRRCPRARPLCRLRLAVDGADWRPSCLACVRSGLGVGDGKGRDESPGQAVIGAEAAISWTTNSSNFLNGYGSLRTSTESA